MLKKLFCLCLLTLMCAAPALAKGKALDLKRAVPPGFDQALGAAFMQDEVVGKYPQGKMPPLEFLGLLSRSFESVGADYSATVVKTLRKVTPQKWHEMRQDGTLDVIFLPFASADKAGVLDEAISKGFVTVEAATAACEASNAMGGKCGWKAKTSTPVVPPKATQQDKTVQLSQAPGTTVCGQVSNIKQLPGLLAQFTATDTDGASGRYFFNFSDGDCGEIVQDGSFVCVDIESHEKNTLGMESLGVKDPMITFVGNCRTPG